MLNRSHLTKENKMDDNKQRIKELRAELKENVLKRKEIAARNNEILKEIKTLRNKGE